MRKRQVRPVPAQTASLLERAAASCATLESFLEARFADLVRYLEQRDEKEADHEVSLGFRHAARTSPSSAARASARSRDRYRASSWFKAAPPFRPTGW